MPDTKPGAKPDTQPGASHRRPNALRRDPNTSHHHSHSPRRHSRAGGNPAKHESLTKEHSIAATQPSRDPHRRPNAHRRDPNTSHHHSRSPRRHSREGGNPVKHESLTKEHSIAVTQPSREKPAPGSNGGGSPVKHRLSIKEYGTAAGVPAVFLHGGPGSGCRPSLCRLFDLDRFRVIAPDQRGAGGSTPHACLDNNTTQDLIADLEKVREHLGIERWLTVGGSWGALLAVAYAEAHPERVTGVVVRSLFLGGEDELQRAFITLPQRIYPDLHAAFIAHLQPAERPTPLAAYYRRILDDDPAVSLPASYVWHDYERVLSQLCPTLPDLAASARATPDDRPPPATPRMEAHYFSHNCFLQPGQLLDDADRLRGIPGIIVQSRYDLLCPPLSAYALSRRWPQSSITLVNGAGHSQSEAGVEQALVDAIETIAGML